MYEQKEYIKYPSEIRWDLVCQSNINMIIQESVAIEAKSVNNEQTIL